MVSKKLLLVDDDPKVLEILQLYLEDEFEIYTANDGQTALNQFYQYQPELVVLDVMMPGMNGFEVCKEIRKTSATPILFLTAKGEEIDRIIGLEIGADDYVMKPFSPREISARIKAILRRGAPQEPAVKKIINFPEITIDINSFTVLVSNQKVDLSPKEVELLFVLASEPGRAFTRENLIEKVWGINFLGESRSIDSHIKRIRRKLKIDAAMPEFIQTVWGIGYKFEVS